VALLATARLLPAAPLIVRRGAFRVDLAAGRFLAAATFFFATDFLAATGFFFGTTFFSAAFFFGAVFFFNAAFFFGAVFLAAGFLAGLLFDVAFLAAGFLITERFGRFKMAFFLDDEAFGLVFDLFLLLAILAIGI